MVMAATTPRLISRKGVFNHPMFVIPFALIAYLQIIYLPKYYYRLVGDLFLQDGLLATTAPDTLETTQSPSHDETVSIKAFQPRPFTCKPSLGDGGNVNPPNKNELVSIIVPEYKQSQYMETALETIHNQTYEPIEIIVSLDTSPSTERSLAIVKDFQAKHQDANLRVYSRKERIHWVANINFLYSMSNGAYVVFQQPDDWIPPNYIEDLVKCMEDHPGASNCFPYINTVGDESMPHMNGGQMFQKSLVGPQWERVDEALSISSAVSFRGLVRRPDHGSLFPYYIDRMYKNHFRSDLLQILDHSIGGDMIQANVSYNKLWHSDSLHTSHLYNRSVLGTMEVREALLHAHTKIYNDAHSYSSSSEKTLKSVRERLQSDWSLEWSHQGLPVEQLQDVLDEFEQRTSQVKRVAVLGGGIQGCVMALMFARNGYDVTIYDKSNDIMNRASAYGEGKIHLGLVYSKDTTMKTAEHMMKSALRFGPYMEYLVGRKIDWDSLKSEAFTYLVPYSSLITPAEFEDFAAKLEHIYERLMVDDSELSYLGQKPPNLITRMETLPSTVNASFFQAGFSSVEYALSPGGIKALLKEALVLQGVKTVFGRTVMDVKRNVNITLGNLRVVTNVSEHDFDVVVNCMWEGRNMIDKKLGLDFPSGGNYRFKFGVKFPYMDEYASLPSVTVVNGPYGDFVR